MKAVDRPGEIAFCRGKRPLWPREARAVNEAEGQGHNAAFDYARLVAALGIVVFHTSDAGGSIGLAALPFFTLVLAYLAVGSAPMPAVRLD